MNQHNILINLGLDNANMFSQICKQNTHFSVPCRKANDVNRATIEVATICSWVMFQL